MLPRQAGVAPMPRSDRAWPYGMEIVDHESVAQSLSAAMMLAQMGIVGCKVIMAVRDNFGIVRRPNP